MGRKLRKGYNPSTPTKKITNNKSIEYPKRYNITVLEILYTILLN